MPEYLSPAVYIEETPSPIAPIAGVGTSTAGFVGVTERGPVEATLVTSYLGYERWFGGHAGVGESFLPYAVAGFFANGGQRLWVARVTRQDATTATLPLPGGTPALVVSALGPGAWGERVFVRVQAGSQAGTFRLTFLYYTQPPPTPFVDPLAAANLRDPGRREPTFTEDYDNLGAAPAGPRFALSVVNPRSRLVQIVWAAGTGTPAPAPSGFAPLAGGVDGTAALSTARFTGSAVGRPVTGLAALATVDDIAILAAPDAVNEVLVPDGGARSGIRDAVIDQCELLRDRVAVLDVPAGQAQPQAVLQTVTRRSDYAAIYYPFVRVLDPVSLTTILVPPSGFVAGVWAFNDTTRGVHKAPANYSLRGIVTQDTSPSEGPLEFALTKGEHDLLNPIGVNVIRDFRAANRGIRVWGARTIWDNPDWIYLNVRRLFNFVEESVEESIQWVVFEPNAEPTWAKVRRSISAFLDRVWRDGALLGESPEQAFFVRCDRTTMTPDDLLNGRLVCLVGLAPVRPAEFVIIRFSQMTIEAAA